MNVEEASLAFQVSSLRKLLGEEGSAWIETVPKHGYRFRAPLNGSARPQDTAEATSPETVRANPARSRMVWAAVFLLSGSALTLGWLALHGPDKHFIDPDAKIVPLTSYPGTETHPSLSPDGSQVVFSWEGEPSKDPDIYVQAIGQGRPVPLTTNPQPEFSPAWSPNGEWIAFCRDTEGGNEIVLVPARGGGTERVIARPSKTWVPVCPNRRTALSWFPSSDALAAVGYVAPESPHVIYVVPVDGGAVRPVTSPPALTSWGDELPSVSPNGRYVAFTRALHREWGEAEIFVLALNADKSGAGEPEPLIPRPSPTRATFADQDFISGLGWIPGRNEVIFSRQGLWTVPLAGRRATRLIPTGGYRPGPFSVSRDGTQLVFSTASEDSSAAWDIWQIPGPASSVRDRQRAAAGRVLIQSTRLDSNAQYSPNGNRIAFTSERSGKDQIWVADADGSNAIQLTHSEASPGSPRWSPDGRYVAYDVEGPASKGDIYVIPAGGGPERRVTTEASQEQVPSWSRDGRWIYYESDRTGAFQLWKTEFPSGSTVQVTWHGGAAASESPDAQWVYYGKRGETGIWRRPVAGGEEERVTDRGYAMQWGLYDKGGCLMNPQRDEVTVECFSFNSNQLFVITRFPNGSKVRPAGGPAFAVSPDGKRILYTRIGREEADLMLIHNFDALYAR